MSRTLGVEIFHNKTMLYIAIIALYLALLIDVCISNIADIKPMVSDFRTSLSGIVLFVFIGMIFIVCQFVIIKVNIIPKDTGLIPSKRISFFRVIQIEQYVLVLIIASVIVQILFTSSYDRLELLIAVLLSYGTAVVLMGLLVYKLFKWFAISRSIVTLLFGIAASFTCVNAATSLYLFDEILITEQPAVISPMTNTEWKLPHEENDYMLKVNQLQFVSMVGYFLVTYAGTVFLLIHHIKKIGIIRFWILVVAPLIFFVYNYPILFKYVLPNAPILLWHPPEIIPNIIIYTISIALLGIVIGIGFLSVSRSIRGNKAVKSALLVTALGFIFYFNAADATVLHVPYPPYGLVNVSFVGFSAFLIYIGLYGSAVSISRDVQLKDSIRKSVEHQFKFLAGLGHAQKRLELEKNIDNIFRETDFHPEQSINSPSFSEDEMKQYANEVLEELIESNKRSRID